MMMTDFVIQTSLQEIANQLRSISEKLDKLNETIKETEKKTEKEE